MTELSEDPIPHVSPIPVQQVLQRMSQQDPKKQNPSKFQEVGSGLRIYAGINCRTLPRDPTLNQLR